MNLIIDVILFAIAAFLFFDLLVVLLSYSICWYEKSNADPSLVENRFSCKNIRLFFLLVIPEVIFNFITVASWPLGLLPNKNPSLQRREQPVLLLHGLFDNQASWLWFKHHLKKAGFSNVVTLNLSSLHNEEVLTELLAKRIDELRLQLGVNKVHLVGHSMGGIIARNYVQLRGGANKIANLVCLGSPHHGSRLATFSLVSLGKVLIPGSDFLTRLNAAPIPDTIEMTNIYTNKDNMVLPNGFNHLNWGTQIELDNMGHTSLIYRKAPIDATIAALNKRRDNDS